MDRDAEVRLMLDALLDLDEGLTEWEVKFVENCESLLELCPLDESEYNTLSRIWRERCS